MKPIIKSGLQDAFHAVDKIKEDVTGCRRYMSVATPLGMIGQGRTLYFRYRETKGWVKYHYCLKGKTLTRSLHEGPSEVLLENVTHFMAKFFPDSQSMLYEIQINHNNQVRGYLHMPNLEKKSNKEARV